MQGLWQELYNIQSVEGAGCEVCRVQGVKGRMGVVSKGCWLRNKERCRILDYKMQCVGYEGCKMMGAACENYLIPFD